MNITQTLMYCNLREMFKKKKPHNFTAERTEVTTDVTWLRAGSAREVNPTKVKGE